MVPTDMFEDESDDADIDVLVRSECFYSSSLASYLELVSMSEETSKRQVGPNLLSLSLPMFRHVRG